MRKGTAKTIIETGKKIEKLQAIIEELGLEAIKKEYLKAKARM
jgi:hypothetical protein